MSLDILSLLPQLINSPDAIANLSRDVKLELITLMEGAIKDVSGWPKVFVNRDTLRPYTPHTVEEAAFVYNDEPRYGLLMGGEGCHSANTRINGVPIPDWKEGPIPTVMGQSLSSQSYLKGQADLYRISTLLGEDVEVTLGHRFLTPAGWHPLRSLSAGSLIAAHGKLNGKQYLGTGTDSRVQDFSCLHPYDGLPSPQEVVAQDILSQLSYSDICSLGMSFLVHLYRTDSSFLWELIPQHYGSSLHALLACVESFLMGDSGCERCLHTFLQPDISWPAHPLGDRTFGTFPEGHGYQNSRAEFVLLGLGRMGSFLTRRQYSHIAPTDLLQQGILPSSALVSFCESYFSEVWRRHETGNIPESLPSLADYPSLYKTLQFFCRLSLQYSFAVGSANNDTISWTECQDIQFANHGDYYDLHVPVLNHYAAHGLLHHNSGKSTAGIIKVLNRVKRGMTGMMCCVAPETLINGIPIAERKVGGPVGTIDGYAWATEGFLEGRADLYRVKTISGEEIVVTKGHRFLTPRGWEQLDWLRVHDFIAADDRYSGFIHQASPVRWTQIESITFLRNGEYYDLSVPGAQHYSACGIFSHNSPDLPHFQRSLWKEFQRWCPWDMVIPSHRRMAHLSWVPSKPFDIVYENGAYIHGVGVKNAGSLEGPNLNFVHFDEARHYPDKSAITVLDGRVRIPGPNGEDPQLWYTTTPRMNWLFEFFGPVQCKCLDCEATHRGEYGIDIQGGQPLTCPECGSPHLSVEDPFFVFKKDSRVVRLETQMNDINLMKDFSIKRGQSLTPKEAEVLLLGRWGEIEEGQPFILTPHWWDQCRDEHLPPLTRTEPMVIALDAATGREFSVSDCFALMVVTRHPLKPETVAIRYYRTWQAQARGKIDFQGTKEDPGPERVLLDFCGYDLESDGRYTYHEDRRHAVMDVVFDPTELHDMATRLTNASVVAFHSLGQTNKRMEADRQLLNLIQSRRIAHDGSSELRMHILNADRKLDTSGKKLRIVKRTKTQRIDLAVALSMASHEVLRLNI